MKKLDRSLETQFGPLKLTGADLPSLMSVLEQNCSNVELQADDVAYGSVAEFIRESKKAPKVVTIRANNPITLITFRPAYASLIVSASDAKGRGIFAELSETIRKYERRPRFLYRYWFLGIFWPVVSVTFALEVPKPYRYVVNWNSVVFVIWLAWAIFVVLTRYAIVQPWASRDLRTFWERNRDAIIVALISAAAGSVATVVVERYVLQSPQATATPTQSVSPAHAPREKDVAPK